MDMEADKLERGSLGYQRIMLVHQRLHRRALLGGAAAAAATAVLAACGGSSPTSTAAPQAKPTEPPTRAPVVAPTTGVGGATPPGAPATNGSATISAPTPVATVAPGGTATTSGAALPADAAAVDQQVYVINTAPDAKVIDFYEAVYARPYIADYFSDPLVRLNKDYQVIPAAAESWKGSEDGKTWTFTLDKNLVWSDGNPVTADDYVATFQYGADPKHAWDFTWFFQGVIKNWDEAIAGKAPLDQLGVKRGEDANTLIVETQVPAPYLPAMLLYSQTLSKAALTKSGPLYNTKPETAVSAGPYILTEWKKDQQIVFSRNAQYTGKSVPMFSKIIQKFADPKTNFTAYQNNEIDFMANPAPAEIKIIQGDADLSKQVYQGNADFPTYYLFFDVTQPPFDNLKVRQAFSHIVDREAIQKTILGPVGSPAYSYLAPGFPGANREGLKDIQKFDVAMGKQLLADAGFPDGKGFPKQTMWLRNETPVNQAVCNSIASMLKQNLGIDVEVSNKDRKLFTDSLTAKPTKIPFGFISYGMDFLDPFNMLSVWLSGGRHSWSNKDFDTKVKEAASFLGPTDQRIKMFQDAEKILVSDVPAVFVYHGADVEMIKPWVKGPAIEPDKLGNKSLHFGNPVYAQLYVTKDVSKRKS
ncbi:MAG: ABC transporter substrate-binding protein [Thermomicrobiales bacterium]